MSSNRSFGLSVEEVAVLPTFERSIVYAHRPHVTGIVRHVVGPDPDYTAARVGP